MAAVHDHLDAICSMTSLFSVSPLSPMVILSAIDLAIPFGLFRWSGIFHSRVGGQWHIESSYINAW